MLAISSVPYGHYDFEERVFIMKKTTKAFPRTASLFLAVVMMLGLLSIPALAFTSNTGLSAAQQSVLPEKGIFLSQNLGDVIMVEDDYYYDRGLGCYVQTYAYSNSTKLSLLLDHCMPIYNLSASMSKLRDANKVAALDTYLGNNQRVTIWGCLSSNTCYKITHDNMDATQALSYIRTTAEYQSNSTLQKYVKYYLEEILNGNEVREALKIIDPSNAKRYDQDSVTQLLIYGDTLLDDWRVENLVDEMWNFRNETTTPYALQQRYTDRQLARYYGDLANAAEYFYADYVRTLDEMRTMMLR